MTTYTSHMMITQPEVKNLKSAIVLEEMNKRPKHCLAKSTVLVDGKEYATIVIDKYTPKNGNPGWYFCFRLPGHVERQTPSVYMPMKMNAVELAEILQNPVDTKNLFVKYLFAGFSKYCFAMNFGYVGLMVNTPIK